MKLLIKNLFSAENKNSHKIIKICGFKIKIRNKEKEINEKLQNITSKLDRYNTNSDRIIKTLYEEGKISKFEQSRDPAKGYIKYLETHITDHCNLNCTYCCHYCNVTKKNFIKVEDFRNDMKELSKKFDIKLIRLMGGEPLLHPEVHKFIYITKEYFPNSEIMLVTNGILLAEASEEFWKAVRDTNIKIDMSKYPGVDKKFGEALDAIGKNTNHQLGWIWIASKFSKSMTFEPVNNIQETFDKCPYKRCVNLINGKLTHCPTAGYMKNYNKYFNENLPEEEGIDIYTHSAQKIMEYLRAPIPTCAHCLPKDKTKWVEWAGSTKDKYAWFVDKS